ncbi:hypothetical protein [Trinickia sp. EG282A]|uniref:hypothetical protein n=1 Tax=Trinickia sp. EG282A TaxID=3237013 RepID=UPI0034D347A1
MNAAMNPSPIKLIEIYDTDADHEVGGQDLPYLVTASYEGDYRAAADLIRGDKSLVAFNVQPAVERCKLPGHLEFCTFESRASIYRFFGVPRPLSQEQELARRYWQSTYARTVGELRAALANLPDDFPLIHTGYDEHREAKNRLGVHVTTNEWEWTTPEHPAYGRYSGWAMRIGVVDLYHWNHIASGSWTDKRHADIE